MARRLGPGRTRGAALGGVMAVCRSVSRLTGPTGILPMIDDDALLPEKAASGASGASGSAGVPRRWCGRLERPARRICQSQRAGTDSRKKDVKVRPFK